MLVKNGRFSEIAKKIKEENLRIIIFGAGVVGVTVAPQLLCLYGLEDYVECYVDNNSEIWNTKIEIGNRQIEVRSLKFISKLNERIAIFICSSRNNGIEDQLKEFWKREKINIYLFPQLCISNFKSFGGKGVSCYKLKPVIPKKLHYIWLGGKEIPKHLQCCIDSWKKHCPSYDIICWNESNYDIEKNRYTKLAYEKKKWAFLSDYARLDILFNHGGIYMDTDVELIRNLDTLLYQEAFTSVEKWQVINFGGCSGAIPYHKGIKEFLISLDKLAEEGILRSSGYSDTRVAIENGYKINGKIQNILGMNIYTYDYFHPYDYMTRQLDLTDDTFAIHHFNGGW